MATLQERIDAAMLLIGGDIGDLAATLNSTLTDAQLRAAPVDVTTSNITGKFREAFESYTPGVKWNETKGNGDLIFVDGNALGASYLVISKSPLLSNTESIIETISTFGMPIELAHGTHLSQRTLGQEFSFEVVDTSNPLADIPDLAILSISQATTVLTINFASPHGLSIGKSIGVFGVSDPRANYPSLVVATVPSTTQITCTAGPGGTIPSLTIATVNNSGYVYFRERLGRSNDGVSQIFENASATNSSFYVRSESGDALPSATYAGSHAVSVGSTTSVQLVNAPYTYAFAPTTEFRTNIQADRVQWYDSGVDSTGQTSNRLLRTQICPNASRDYKLRIRATNNKGLTTPVAQIVSVVKTASTTATITFDRPHGLTTSSLIVAYGVRDQTNFANLTTATTVASIVNSTTITCIWGASVTATSYGGYVAVVNGGNLMSSLGAIGQVGSTATLTNGILSLVGNTTWAGFSIGDLLELVGVRNAVNGATLGIDGAWRVRNVSGTTVELEAIGWTAPANFTVTNCGGGVIKRTNLRISFIRIFNYQRERIEFLTKPSGDSSAAVSVAHQGNITINQPTLAAGTNLVGSAAMSIPQVITDVASAAITATGNTAAITPSYGNGYEASITVTAFSGTTPTMDVSIEESDDSGTNWYKVYDYPRITGNGIYRSPKLALKGNRLRYVQTLTGTTPSFTRVINRLQISDNIGEFRQSITRTMDTNTINTTAGNLSVHNCTRYQMLLNFGAITTTAPQLQIEGTDDGTNWYLIGTPVTAVANSTISYYIEGINAATIRAKVVVAGSGATLGYLLLKGYT